MVSPKTLLAGLYQDTKCGRIFGVGGCGIFVSFARLDHICHAVGKRFCHWVRNFPICDLIPRALFHGIGTMAATSLSRLQKIS
jgi:hypothetical protein